jgi:probable phosphoglycerate mutase
MEEDCSNVNASVITVCILAFQARRCVREVVGNALEIDTRPGSLHPDPGPVMTRARPNTAPQGESTLVLLVRHGLTPKTGAILPGRAPGLQLSDAGRRQADAVARRLARLPRVAAVYTSPLERARETAAAIARARCLALRVERGLNECDVGEWTGLALKRVRRKPEWQLVRHHPSGFRFPGGESFVEMQARATGTLARLLERHPRQTIVAVSHADPIKAVVAHALGLHLDLFQRIAVAPGSITAIAYRHEAPLVLTVNSLDGDLTWLVT